MELFKFTIYIMKHLTYYQSINMKIITNLISLTFYFIYYFQIKYDQIDQIDQIDKIDQIISYLIFIIKN